MAVVGAVVARASWVAATILLAGCGEDPVHARAVWIDELEQGDGTRRIHVYDRGGLDELALLLPADVPQLRAQLGPKGRGLLVRGNQRHATYVDIEDARHLPLRLTEPPNNVADAVQFSEDGEALHWREDDELSVVPLMPGAALEWAQDGPWLEPMRTPLLGNGWIVSAPSAPILFARDALSPQSVGGGYGQIVAFRYFDHRHDAASLTELARLDLPPPASLRRERDCADPSSCRADWVVDPAGESLVLDYGEFSADCRFRRWRWGEGSAAECVALPEGLGVEPVFVGLLAAIDEDVLVLRDHLRLHRLDLKTGTVASIPIIGMPPHAWRTADSGRALIWVSLEGPTIRVDEAGVHLVTTVQTTCAAGASSGGLQVSPDGHWVAWSCRSPAGGSDVIVDPEQFQNVVVRTSAGGVERFEGIPMVVLAIDDRGDVLIYSTEAGGGDDALGVSPSRQPLSLWTLSHDSVLRRADRLEPTPAPTLLLEQDQTAFIQAAPVE